MVTQIHIILESERDLAVGEQPTGGMLVIEPLEDRLERIEPTIEREHKLRCWCFYLCRGHGNFVCFSTGRDAE